MAPPRRGDLSPEEKDLLGVIATGNTEEAGRLLGSKNVRVNCLDELFQLRLVVSYPPATITEECGCLINDLPVGTGRLRLGPTEVISSPG